MNESLNSCGKTLALSGGSILLQLTIFLLVGLIAAWRLKKFGPILQTRFYKVLTLGVILLVIFMAGGGSSPAQTRFVIPAPVFESPTIVQHEVATSPAVPSPAPTKTSAEPAREAQPAPEIPINPLGYISLVWLLGVLFLIGKLLISQVKLVLLKRRASNLAGSETATLAIRIAKEIGVRLPRIYESAEVDGPFLAGVFRPSIFLPADGLALEDLEIALRHEFSHVKANDCLWGAARELLCIAFWPQPLMWRFGAAARQAAEEATDRMLLLDGVNKTAYANCLLRLAATQTGLQGDLGIGVAESKSSVSRRIESMLSEAGRVLSTVPKPARFSFMGATALMAFTASGLVAFGVPQLPQRASRHLAQWIPPANFSHWFSLPSKMGWQAEPAWISTFGSVGIPRSSGSQVAMPPKLSADQMNEVNQVNILADRETRFSLEYSDFPLNPDSPIPKLLHHLASHPHSFYAEAELAEAYRKAKDFAKSNDFRMRSLQDAPTILASRVVYGDGRPAANQLFQVHAQFAPSANEVSEVLVVPTDDKGCFYFPTYKTSFPWYGNVWQPHGPREQIEELSTKWGMLVARTKVVYAPYTYLRSRLQFLKPYSDHQFTQNPLSITGHYLNAKWHAYPGASYYKFGVMSEVKLPPNATTEDDVRFDESLTKVSKPEIHLPMEVLHQPLKTRRDWKNIPPEYSSGIRSGVFLLFVRAFDKNDIELSSSDTFSFSIDLPKDELHPW